MSAQPKLCRKEIALVLRTAELLKSKGLSQRINVSTFCKEVDISRKNAYKHKKNIDLRVEALKTQVEKLQKQHEEDLHKLSLAQARANQADLAWRVRDVLVAYVDDIKEKRSGPDTKAAEAYRKMQETEKLPRTRAARLLGLTPHILSTWERKGSQKSLRGKTSTYTEEQIRFVVRVWKDYSNERKKVKIAAFMKYLRKQWKTAPWLTPCPSRKTVEDMLLANGCRKPDTKPPKSGVYIARVKRYFPNAQVLLDGKQVIVSLRGQKYPFALEFCKDMASDALTGSAVGRTEDSTLVKGTLNGHRQQYGIPLSVLADNGSANNVLTIELGAEGCLVIKAHPYRPQTKGQIEGEYSFFEKTVSIIEIEGQSDEEIAMGILKVVAELYLRLRNSSPRCNSCPFTPEKLMQYQPEPGEVKNAYRLLQAEKERKKQRTEQRLKISREHSDLIESIVKEHRLEGELLILKRSLKHVELSTLKEAEVRFGVQSQRDTFEPSKRSMAYFCTIARNVQAEKDATRRQNLARRRYGLEQESRRERDAVKSELTFRKEKEMIKKQPEKVILNALKAEMAVPEGFRDTISVWRQQIDEAIESIKRRKSPLRQATLIDETRQCILDWYEISIETRQQLINRIERRMQSMGLNVAKSVTPK